MESITWIYFPWLYTKVVDMWRKLLLWDVIRYCLWVSSQFGYIPNHDTVLQRAITSETSWFNYPPSSQCFLGFFLYTNLMFAKLVDLHNFFRDSCSWCRWCLVLQLFFFPLDHMHTSKNKSLNSEAATLIPVPWCCPLPWSWHSCDFWHDCCIGQYWCIHSTWSRSGYMQEILHVWQPGGRWKSLSILLGMMYFPTKLGS